MKGTIEVKEWFFNKVNDTAMSCHVMLVGEYENGMLRHDLFRVEEVLNESEKAIQVSLDAETSGGHVRTWKTWIPKSVINSMNLR